MRQKKPKLINMFRVFRTAAIVAQLFIPPCTNGFFLTGSRRTSILDCTRSYYNRLSCSSSRTSSDLFASSNSNGNDDDNEQLKPAIEGMQAVKTTSFPFSSYLLVAITIRSLTQLITLPTEIPGAFLFANTSYSIDYISTAFDLFFVGFGVQNLLKQNGITGVNMNDRNSVSPGVTYIGTPSMADLECRVTLDVGRERGTMMEQEWAASGARLLLPINLRFTDQQVKIDFPGEESLGGRFCYRLDVLDDCVSFIGRQGEVRVNVEGGCWVTLPITERKADNGEAKLRFFLDFPEGASRNDVTLPAGRIFFSGVCFANANDAPLDIGESLVAGPMNVGIITEGGITMKRNGILNLYGAIGDTNAILGRYKVGNVKIRNDGCSVE